MNDPQLDQFKKALDERAESLDGATLSRLRQARTKALDQPKSWWAGINSATGLSAASAAAIALMAVFIWQEPMPSIEGIEQPPLLGLEIATLNEDLELIEELDFYYWLNAQETASEESIQTQDSALGIKT